VANTVTAIVITTVHRLSGYAVTIMMFYYMTLMLVLLQLLLNTWRNLPKINSNWWLVYLGLQKPPEISVTVKFKVE